MSEETKQIDMPVVFRKGNRLDGLYGFAISIIAREDLDFAIEHWLVEYGYLDEKNIDFVTGEMVQDVCDNGDILQFMEYCYLIERIFNPRTCSKEIREQAIKIVSDPIFCSECIFGDYYVQVENVIADILRNRGGVYDKRV